jgi:CRISPR/Cas system-associated exonuclease Cas4 (RecB family)
VRLPKVSYSAKSTYDWCPRQYKYVYLDKYPPDKPVYPATVVGTGVHALINQMYIEKVFTLPFLRENLPRHIQLAIKEHKFPTSPTQIDAMLKMGREIVDNFYRMADREGILIPSMKTEWRFKVTLDTFAISGVVDLIILLKGRVYIIDFKTGLHDLTQEEVDANEQLTFYAFAVWKLLGIDDAKVGFFYPRLGTIRYSERTTRSYDQLIVDTRKMLEKVAQKQFAPTYVKCNWCRFSSRCAAEDMAAKTGLNQGWFYTEPRR